MAHMDSGAELNGMGQNWVPFMETHGGVVETLTVPQTVQWSDEGVTREANSVVKMHFKIAGSEIEGELTFHVFPWDTDHLIFGWEAMRRHKILGKLEDLLALQSAQGLATGTSTSDGNQVLTDMDGHDVATDQLLFADEPEPKSPPTATELTPAEEKEMSAIIEKYKDVFEPKPAGAAKVEPMAVVFKEGWAPPPMEAFRTYSPRVEAAIESDLKKQLELGVVEPSDADYGCPVHAVPKPDSESGYRFSVDFRNVNSGVLTERVTLYQLSPRFSLPSGGPAIVRKWTSSGGTGSFWFVRLTVGTSLLYGKEKCTSTVWPLWGTCNLVSMFSGAWPACLRSPSPAV